MGTCCSAHLATKVRTYALDAQNGAVTVKPIVIENPDIEKPFACDYCKAPSEFTVSYYPK